MSHWHMETMGELLKRFDIGILRQWESYSRDVTLAFEDNIEVSEAHKIELVLHMILLRLL